MFEGIEYRGYGQAIVEELAKYASVPVWNGLTNEYHPTQILADFLTLREHFGKLQGLKFAYMGDARYNMGNSLMIGCAKMGLHFVACAPKAYWPDPALVEKCKEFARVSGGSITLSEDTDAVAGAISSYLPAAESDVYNQPSEFYGGQTVYKDIVEFAGKVPAFDCGAYYSDVRSALTDAVTNIVQNNADIDSEMQNAQDTVEFNIAG